MKENEYFFKRIETKDLVMNFQKADWIIVDTRITDAYNGWPLEGVFRGGHIPGSVDFSAKWLLSEDNEKDKILYETLLIKGISKNKNIVLYDANAKDALNVANYMKSIGYNNLYIYDISQWSNEKSLAMVQYPNYHLLVPAFIINELLKGKTPQTFNNEKQIKIVEASWGDSEVSYKQGHLPSAFHINTDSIEPPTLTTPPNWLLGNNYILNDFVLKNGFKKTDCVIISSNNQSAAFRLSVVLKYIGISDVRVLNGTDNSWTNSGYELDKKYYYPTACNDFGAVVPHKKHIIATEDDVKKGIKDTNNFTLVDVRTWEEYIGKTSGYSYVLKAGRIPGAIYGFAGHGNVNSVNNYRNIDGTMRNGYEVLNMLKSQGIDLSSHLSFMCGGGWRASEVYTYADVMGLKNISVYSDGWGGWSSNPANPIEIGIPVKK